MRPQRPYLLRAFYDWLLDSQLTPHIVVNANYYGVDVPFEFVKDGQIILNIAPHSVSHFDMNHEAVSFSARFGGVPRQVYVPMGALLAIYARENGAGTMFQIEECYEDEANEAPERVDKPKVVMQLVEGNDESQINGEDDEPPQPPKGRPSLRVVK